MTTNSISIDGKSYPFEAGSPADYYWSFWRNNVYSEEGECGVELEAGDQILFFPSCYGPSCPPAPEVLGIETPPTAEVGEPVDDHSQPLQLRRQALAGGGHHRRGGWGSSATTNFEGKATLTFPGDESYTLRATGASGENPLRSPGKRWLRAQRRRWRMRHPAPVRRQLAPVSGSTTTSTTTVTASYTGPYAVVAARDGYPRRRRLSPREGPPGARRDGERARVRHLDLAAAAPHLPWSLLGLQRLSRALRARPLRAGQLLRSGVGRGLLLLSAALTSAPGRYVLDIAATDSAGDSAPLDRGSSRIVFYVK